MATIAYTPYKDNGIAEKRHQNNSVGAQSSKNIRMQVRVM
jgi:hypothetical protein